MESLLFSKSAHLLDYAALLYLHITDISIEIILLLCKMIVLLEYIDHYPWYTNLTSEGFQPDCNTLSIMLALFLVLSGTYYV